MSSGDPFEKFSQDIGNIDSTHLPTTPAEIKAEMRQRYNQFYESIKKFDSISSSRSSSYRVFLYEHECDSNEISMRCTLSARKFDTPMFQADVKMYRDKLVFFRHTTPLAGDHLYRPTGYAPNEQQQAISDLQPSLSRAFA